MRFTSFSLLFISFLVCCPEVLAEGKAAPGKGKETKGNEKKLKGKFTIGKDTTYIEGPRDQEGYIDYAAALNKHLSQGVTPQTNAAVLLWKALGPRPQNRVIPGEFFQLLGMDVPPERGEYFIELFPYLKKRSTADTDEIDEIRKEIDNYRERTMNRPWTAKEFPKMAGWLKANEKPLHLVVEASKRPHYYAPVVPGKDKPGAGALMGQFDAGRHHYPEMAYGLTARAMLRLGRGDHEGAWSDLLACHKLGRLTGAGGNLMTAIFGIHIDRIASEGDSAFLNNARLTGKQIENCLRDLQNLAPLPDLAEVFNRHERFTFLDLVMKIDRDGSQFLVLLWTWSDKEDAEFILAIDRVLQNIDWDPILRDTNRRFDRVVAAIRKEDRAAREKRFEELDPKPKKRDFFDFGPLMKREEFAKTAKRLLEEHRPATILAQLIGDFNPLPVLIARKIQTAADRVRQVQDNVRVAFALAWYQRERGNYPKNLEALTPKYLENVPHDLFSGKPLIYRPTEKGVIVYSVGVNGKDEQGRWEFDADDLSIRVSLPKLK